MKLFELLRKLAESAFSNLSLIAAPLLPAALFGLSTGAYIATLYGNALGLIIGLAAGFSIEAAGYNAFHAAQRLGNWRPVYSYLAIGIGVTAAIEYHDPQRLIIGLVGFGIVAVVYYATSATSVAAQLNSLAEAERQQQAELERQQAEFERQQRAADNETKRQIKMIRAGAAAATVGSVAGSASVTAAVAAAVASGRLHADLPEVDNVDATIMQLLTATPDATYTQLAAQLGMSRPAATKRIKNLAAIANARGGHS